MENFEKFGRLEDIRVLYVDLDGRDRSCHKENRKIFSKVDIEFIHDKTFFNDYFSPGLAEKYAKVIPNKCSAEKSIAFLKAWLEDPNLVIMIDDDTYPAKEYDFIGTHFEALNSLSDRVVGSDNSWFNPLKCLKLNTENEIFSRGFPYELRKPINYYIRSDASKKVVLNQGLWFNVPDLDAITILYEGGMNGIPRTKSIALLKERVILEPGTYTTLCAMNVSFLPKIIPAFYQLQMGGESKIDRFDDIWSGIFIKRIIDAMEERMALGAPPVFHDKTPRPVFQSLYSELDGIVINEELWRMVDNVQDLDTSDYLAAYRSLITGLRDQIKDQFTQRQKKYLNFLFNSMDLWCEVCEKLE